jgi:hypothetical protein
VRMVTHAARISNKPGRNGNGVVWAGAGVAWRLCAFFPFEVSWTVWRRQFSMRGDPVKIQMAQRPLPLPVSGSGFTCCAQKGLRKAGGL